MESAFQWLSQLWEFFVWLLPAYHHNHLFEVCVSVTWGRRVRVRKYGIFFYWPPVTSVFYQDANMQVFLTPPVALFDTDGSLTVKACIRYTVVDPVRALIDTENVTEAIQTETLGNLSEYVASQAPHTIHGDRKTLNLGLTRVLRRRLARFGVKVQRAMIVDLSKTIVLHHMQTPPSLVAEEEE